MTTIQFASVAERNIISDGKMTVDEDVNKLRLSSQALEEDSLDQKKLGPTGVFVLKHKTVYYDKRSLFCFSSNNSIRKFLVRLIEKTWFDYSVLGVIMLNSLCLALYDYSDRDDESTMNKTITILGQIFTVLFLLEAISKILAMGFISHKNSYLRDPWNIVDFIVAITGIVDLLPNVPNLKALRTLRVFRPLKSINAVPSMRRLVSTLIISLPELGSVVIFLSFIFLLFGILGLYQFNGEIYSQCRTTIEPISSTDWPKYTPITI